MKFFLVGSVSSAVILYGLSFVYGATGSTAIAAIGPALQANHPLLLLGLVLTLLGKALGWRWVSNRWFRTIHLMKILGVVLLIRRSVIGVEPVLRLGIDDNLRGIVDHGERAAQALD